MKRFVAIAALALSLAAASSAAAAPVQVGYPNAVTGISHPVAVAISSGKVWVAGDTGTFNPTKVSCILQSTGQKCSSAFPVTLTDSEGVEQVQPKDVDIGTDGSVWVANAGDEDFSAESETVGSITRINPTTGAFTTYPSQDVGPQAMVVGAEGDIWTGLVNSNSIGRHDPVSGAMRAGYPKATGVASSSSFVIGPEDLVVDDEGDVWASIFNGNSSVTEGQVTKIDASANAVASGFPKSTGGGREVGDMAVGTDGDIYINHDSGAQVSRLDPETGANRDGWPKLVGSSFGQTELAVGLDGDLWVGKGTLGELTRRNPEDATAAERAGYPLDVPDATLGLTIDPVTGDPWLAVEGSGQNPNRVVHVDLDGVVATVPGPPTGVSAAPGNASATVSFSAPASNGGSPILSYTVTCTAPGQPGKATQGSGSPLVVSGLANGVRYSCTVRANNAQGGGAESAAVQVTPSAGGLPGGPGGGNGGGGGGGSPGGSDSTPPQAKLAGKATQKAGPSVAVTVSCPTEACTASASGTVSVPGAAKTYKLKKATKKIAAGKKATLKLKLSKKALKAVKKALKRKKKVRAKLKIRVKDAAGNQRPTASRTVKLRK